MTDLGGRQRWQVDARRAVTSDLEDRLELISPSGVLSADRYRLLCAYLKGSRYEMNHLMAHRLAELGRPADGLGR